MHTVLRCARVRCQRDRSQSKSVSNSAPYYSLGSEVPFLTECECLRLGKRRGRRASSCKSIQTHLNQAHNASRVFYALSCAQPVSIRCEHSKKWQNRPKLAQSPKNDPHRARVCRGPTRFFFLHQASWDWCGSSTARCGVWLRVSFQDQVPDHSGVQQWSHLFGPIFDQNRPNWVQNVFFEVCAAYRAARAGVAASKVLIWC